MSQLTLIVIEDSQIAYEMCCKLDREIDRSLIEIDLEHSRTIVENEHKRNQLEKTLGISPNDTQTYEEILNYLSSKNIPENLILVLDLALGFNPEVEKQIHYDNNFPTGLSGINSTQAASIQLACRSINNPNLKKLLICFATTGVGGNQGAEYSYLDEQIKQAKLKLPKHQRKLTVVQGLKRIETVPKNDNNRGGPFAPKDRSTSERTEYSYNFINNAVVRFNELTKSSIVEKKQYKFTIEGNLDASGEPQALSLKEGKDQITSGTTEHYARLIYQLCINGVNGLEYSEILDIKNNKFGTQQNKSQKEFDDLPPQEQERIKEKYKSRQKIPPRFPISNDHPGLKSFAKEKMADIDLKGAADFIYECVRHIKNKCSNFKITNIFYHDKKNRKYRLERGAIIKNNVK
jgi:hypothetical protein